MNKITVLEGELNRDHRGFLASMNNFIFEGVERYYFIHHPDTKILRGWHGHQFEKKWFQCVKGKFVMAFVKIDNWECPSDNLQPEIFEMSENKSQLICVPEGYANLIKAMEPDSVLLTLSGKRFHDALDDSWRYDPAKWVDLSKY